MTTDNKSSTGSFYSFVLAFLRCALVLIVALVLLNVVVLVIAEVNALFMKLPGIVDGQIGLIPTEVLEIATMVS